jgi:cytochrome c oxidase subunit 2
MRRGGWTWTLTACALAGCSGPQSALDPHAPQAHEIYFLFLVFMAVAVVVWLGVAIALAWGLVRRRATRADPLDLDTRGERRRGVLVTSLTLATGAVVLALSILSYSAQRYVFARDAPAVSIKVTGHQWWWQVEYEDGDASKRFMTANEIHVPVGQVVQVKLETADVIHSFWPPSLNGKTDLVNGQQNELRFTAEREGVYRGQCAEFCGQQHAHMGFEIIADRPDSFNRWRAKQVADADDLESPGALIFRQKGCAFCHTIRGTLAAGRAGPDLTHVGGRRTIAAALLERNVGNLGAWIADPQHFKPGAKMPSMPLSGRDLSTLAVYLDGLK